MDVDGKNPSNREDLKLYWHHLQIEGLNPSDVYEDLLIRLGILTPEITTLDVRYQSHFELLPSFELPRGKTNNVVSEHVRHKPACTSTEKSQKLEISDLSRRGIVLSE